MRNSTCARKSRNSFFVTISALPYFPPAAAGSFEFTTVPLLTGSFTIAHFIGKVAASLGPFQYVQLASSISLLPSKYKTAPEGGLVPTPTCAFVSVELAMKVKRKQPAIIRLKLT